MLCPKIITYHDQANYIYAGGAFTLSEYRNQKITPALTSYALTEIKNKGNFDKQKPLILFFGMVSKNVGKDIKLGLAPILVRSFMNLTKEVSEKKDFTIECHQYKNFMPTYDPDSTKCEPLPDDKAIPVFWHSLIYPSMY